MSFRNRRLAAEVEHIVASYINRTELWDRGIQKRVLRHHTVAAVPGRVAARVGCHVVHDTGGRDRDRGVYSREWTEGLLRELAALLRGRAFTVVEVLDDADLINLEVTR